MLRTTPKALAVEQAHTNGAEAGARPATDAALNADEEGFITLAEAALFLRLSEKSVRQFAQDNLLPAYRVGKKWLFKRSELQDSARYRKGPLPEGGA